MSISNQRTRFGYPITIAESTLDLREGASVITLTIPAGTYWPYLGIEYGSREGLFNRIIALIGSSSAAGVYTFEAAVPTQSVGEGGVRRGLLVRRRSGSGTWGIDWSTSTLDPRLLGWPKNFATDVATSGGFISAPREVLGAWIPTRVRTFANRQPKRILYPSSDDVAADSYHQADYGSRTMRSFRFQHLPAACIINGKAANGYGSIANIEDDNGSFERLWESMANRDEIIVFHELDPIAVNANDVDVFEVVRLRDHSQAEELRNCISLRNSGGEFYDVEFLAQVVEGNRDD